MVLKYFKLNHNMTELDKEWEEFNADENNEKYNNLNQTYKSIFNYTIIFPVTYHTYGGIRHFIWDKYPKLLTNNSVTKSSVLLFGLSGISSILFENIIKKNI